MISGNRSWPDVLLGYKGFDFERLHDARGFRKWAQENNRHSWTVSVTYIVVIFSLRWFMQDKPRMKLRYPLALWNFLAAIFSVFAALRTLPFMGRMLMKHGAMGTICAETIFLDEVVGFWGAMFMLSKVPELLDTVFIVLRKQKLIVLHWYHHASVVVFVFYSYPTWVGAGLFYMTMNYTIHSIMYTYYMFRSLGFRCPRMVNVVITTLQIVQMILACAITCSEYHRMAIVGKPCGFETIFQIYRTFIVYCSYFVLFFQYFIDTYCQKQSASDLSKKDN